MTNANIQLSSNDEMLIYQSQDGTIKVDMIAVGHGFTEVPPKFFTFATDYVLFRTEDSIDTRKPYIRSFEKVKKMQASVNRKAKHNPHYHQRLKQ